jgi:competence transcription factor ComK
MIAYYPLEELDPPKKKEQVDPVIQPEKSQVGLEESELNYIVSSHCRSYRISYIRRHQGVNVISTAGFPPVVKLISKSCYFFTVIEIQILVTSGP